MFHPPALTNTPAQRAGLSQDCVGPWSVVQECGGSGPVDLPAASPPSLVAPHLRRSPHTQADIPACMSKSIPANSHLRPLLGLRGVCTGDVACPGENPPTKAPEVGLGPFRQERSTVRGGPEV